MFFMILDTIESEEDKEKAKRLYDYQRTFIANFVKRLVSDPYVIEDIVQETMIRAIRRVDQFEDVTCRKTSAFCRIVAKHLAMDHYRSRKYYVDIENEKVEQEGVSPFQPSPATPIDQLLDKEGYQLLLSYIAKLSDNYKTVFRLRYIYRYTDKEIAEMLNLTVNTVNVRCYRARKKMQAMLRGDDQQ